MFYAPRRCLFIHIPRTAGNSITSALCHSAIGLYDVIACTSQQINGIWRRHLRASLASERLKDWNSIYKFSIYRTEADIIESEERLIQRDIASGKLEDPTVNQKYKELMLTPKKDRYLSSIPDVWKFWCQTELGEDLGIEKILFEELHDRWHEICDKCQLQRVELPHLNKG